MEKVSIDDVEPTSEDDIDRRKLTDPLNTAHVAVNRYVLEPGERFAESLHTHMDQEEVFIIIEGKATFETMNSKATVSENEVLRFAPGEFQSGKNDSEERVVAFALGAPRDSEDIRIARIPGIGDIACPECGHDTMRIPTTETDLVCPECGAELAVE